jgi:hypothetical protein
MNLLTFIAASRRRVTVDPDAADYFARIVSADSSISTANKDAVNNFIVGCKADGIWDAIKASCLLAGPDTLAGALVPLVGPAPTNYNFGEADYSRTTGLTGDGSTKYLNSNHANNSDPQNSKHVCVWKTDSLVNISYYFSQRVSSGAVSCSNYDSRCNSNTYNPWPGQASTPGFNGVSRSESTSYARRRFGITGTATATSETPTSDGIHFFANWNGSASGFSTHTLSFYSIGESLDLALLDARLTTYMAALT